MALALPGTPLMPQADAMIPAWVVVLTAGEAGLLEVAWVAKCTYLSGVE